MRKRLPFYSQSRSCSAPNCYRGTRNGSRYCNSHRSLYLYYGAPALGPSKALLRASQRHVQRTLGPIHKTDCVFHSLMSNLVAACFKASPDQFVRRGRSDIRWGRYRLIAATQDRLKRQYPKEGHADLCVRLLWAFVAVQYLELSGLYEHVDRTHFLTSVYRLMMKADPTQKPNQTYIRHALGAADKLLAVLAGNYAREVMIQDQENERITPSGCTVDHEPN